MKTKILIIFFLFFSLVVFSQNFYIRGYIINDKDTVLCYIRRTKLTTMQNLIYVKKDLNDKNEILYLPADIQGFYMEKYGLYISKKIIFRKKSLTNSTSNKLTLKTAFVKRLVSGKANLYLYIENNKTKHFFIEKDTIFKELYEKKTIRETEFSGHISGMKTGNGLFVQKNYIGILSLYLNDNPDILKDIPETKCSEKSFIKLFNNYNKAFCKTENIKSITGRKKMETNNLFKFSFTAGTELSKFKFQSTEFRFKYLNEIKDNYTPGIFGGFKFDYVFPATKNKMNFSSGLLFSYHHFSTVFVKDLEVTYIYNINLNQLNFKIPVLLKYPVLASKSLFIYAGITQNISFYSNSYFYFTVDFGNKYKHYYYPQETDFSTAFTAGFFFKKKISDRLSFIVETIYETGASPYNFSENIHLFSVLSGIQF